MNIYQALRKDHDLQRELLDKLVNTSGNTHNRDRLFKDLKKELQIHAEAEERFYYVPIISEDLTQDQARHGIAEHHEIDELISKLEQTDYSSPGWLTLAKSLQEKVEHHLEDEEHTIFQLSGKVLPESEKKYLADDYLEYMEEKRAEG